MVSDRRVQVIEFLAGFLDLPTSSLDDRFDVVNDFDWSQWDDEDYGLLFEQFMERFAVRDARFDFGGRYRGPLILKPLAWLWWRLFRYPRVVFDRMTVEDLVRMAERGEWDSSLEAAAS